MPRARGRFGFVEFGDLSVVPEEVPFEARVLFRFAEPQSSLGYFFRRGMFPAAMMGTVFLSPLA